MRNFKFVRLGYPVMVAVSRSFWAGRTASTNLCARRGFGCRGAQPASWEPAWCAQRGGHSCRARRAAALRAHRYVLQRPACGPARRGARGQDRHAHQAITELCSLPGSQIVDIQLYESSRPTISVRSFVNRGALRQCSRRRASGLLHAVENSLGRARGSNGPHVTSITDYQLYVVDADAHVAVSACWNAIS
ncbi:MAG: hypothetical protein ACLT98_04995 [Eggerthellaceae bacterium]